MKLYYHPASPLPEKRGAIAALLGIELRPKRWTFCRRRANAGLLKLNPQGKVPTLTDGDFAMSQTPSSSIWRRRLRKVPLPDDARGRADVLPGSFGTEQLGARLHGLRLRAHLEVDVAPRRSGCRRT